MTISHSSLEICILAHHYYNDASDAAHTACFDVGSVVGSNGDAYGIGDVVDSMFVLKLRLDHMIQQAQNLKLTENYTKVSHHGKNATFSA